MWLNSHQSLTSHIFISNSVCWGSRGRGSVGSTSADLRKFLSTVSLCHDKYTLTICIYSVSLSHFLADVMYNGEMNEKIKLLYRLHIPPGKKFQVEKSGCPACFVHNTEVAFKFPLDSSVLWDCVEHRFLGPAHV